MMTDKIPKKGEIWFNESGEEVIIDNVVVCFKFMNETLVHSTDLDSFNNRFRRRLPTPPLGNPVLCEHDNVALVCDRYVCQTRFEERKKANPAYGERLMDRPDDVEDITNQIETIIDKERENSAYITPRPVVSSEPMQETSFTWFEPGITVGELKTLLKTIPSYATLDTQNDGKTVVISWTGLNCVTETNDDDG